MRKKRTALAVIQSDSVFESLQSSCGRFADRFDRIASAPQARVFATNNYYNLILVQHPLEGLDNVTFLSSLRSASSLCRNSPVLSFSDDPKELTTLKTLGGTLRETLPTNSTPFEIGQAVIRLMSMSARSPIELLVQMVVEKDGRTQRLACQTKNLSSTGMLLRTGNALPSGSELNFSFNLPNDERTIEGTGKVVRRAYPKSERIDGMGVLFTNLDGESSKSITDFIRVSTVLPAVQPVRKKSPKSPPRTSE